MYNVLGDGSNFLVKIMIYFDLLIENPNLQFIICNNELRYFFYYNVIDYCKIYEKGVTNLVLFDVFYPNICNKT